MTSLALVGAGALAFVGVIWMAVSFARKYERERIQRWLAEKAAERSQDSIAAHEEAEKDGREEYL